MDYQPSVIHYRESEDLDPAPAAPVQKAVNRLFAAFTWVVLLVVLAGWTVVGAIFWIPLLFRAMLRFSVSLVQSVFVGRRPDGAARVLRDAVSFYRRGFVVAIESVTNEEIEGEAHDPQTGNRILLEVLWAIPVWYLILFATGWVQASPADLWSWLASVPWAEMWGAMIDGVRGWIRRGG